MLGRLMNLNYKGREEGTNWALPPIWPMLWGFLILRLLAGKCFFYWRSNQQIRREKRQNAGNIAIANSLIVGRQEFVNLNVGEIKEKPFQTNMPIFPLTNLCFFSGFWMIPFL
jgi:hypothetical protein